MLFRRAAAAIFEEKPVSVELGFFNRWAKNLVQFCQKVTHFLAQLFNIFYSKSKLHLLYSTFKFQ